MYRHFKRDPAAARIQEQDWQKIVRYEQRLAKYVSTPCAYCGVAMTLSEADAIVPTSETLDHIVPRSKGGTVTVKCCVICNRDKHHLTLNEWRAVLMLRSRRVVIFHFERIAIKNLVRNTLLLNTCRLSSLISC